jgi:AcrR family transcriptional regulator
VIVTAMALARAARRDAVEQSALRLFAQRGFDRVTVDDICAESGVSPATFFRYFGAKDDLLFGYTALAMEDLRAALAAVPVDIAVPLFIRQFVREFAKRWQQRADIFAVREPIILGSSSLIGRAVLVQLGWEAELADAIRDRAGDDAATWAAVAVGVLRAGWQRWRDGHASSLTAAVDAGLRAVGSMPSGDRPAQAGTAR